MSIVKFYCPTCKQLLDAPQDMAGQEVDCPACQGVMKVPSIVQPLNLGEIRFSCPDCQLVMQANPSREGEVVECQRCKKELEIPSVSGKKFADITKKNEIIGLGCLVQLLGFVLCFFFFPVGVLVGIILLVAGGRIARKYICGACGNKLGDAEVKMCPACQSWFRKG